MLFLSSEQLKRLDDINMELTETLLQTWLSITQYCEEHDIPIPHEDRFNYLLQRLKVIIEERNEEINPISSRINYFIRRKVTERKSDEDVPVPLGWMRRRYKKVLLNVYNDWDDIKT